MQCTSFIPMYYQPRSINGATSGFPWNLLSGNANYGDQRGFNNMLQPPTVYQYSSYDKEAMRQIIQNHETTFRCQVQELHRLYKRQRELMDEMRMREIITQHMQKSESVQCLSQQRSDISQTSHAPSWLLGDHSQSKLPDLAVNKIHQSPSFITYYIPEQSKKGCDEVNFISQRSDKNRKRSLDLELPADVYCANDAPNKLVHVQPTSDSEIGSAKTSGRMNCLIDLNEPVPLESLSLSSSCAFVTHNSHMEIVCDDRLCGSVEAKPESPNSACSDDRNPSMAIDLNSMPINCFPETEATLEGVPKLIKETTLVLDNILVTGTPIDLNTGVVNDHLSAIKSVRGLGSESPLCPENEECSFRQKSKDAHLQTSLLSEKLEENVKPMLDLDIIAAQTLLVISSSTVNPEVAENSGNCLYWFADIVSSTGGNLENDITGYFGTAMKKTSEDNAIGIGKETAEGFLEMRQQRKNVARKACPKLRKCSKIDVVKKSKSSILKQPTTRSKQGVLQSWGRIRKRQGGHRRRTSKFLSIS